MLDQYDKARDFISTQSSDMELIRQLTTQASETFNMESQRTISSDFVNNQLGNQLVQLPEPSLLKLDDDILAAQCSGKSNPEVLYEGVNCSPIELHERSVIKQIDDLVIEPPDSGCEQPHLDMELHLEESDHSTSQQQNSDQNGGISEVTEHQLDNIPNIEDPQLQQQQFLMDDQSMEFSHRPSSVELLPQKRQIIQEEYVEEEQKEQSKPRVQLSDFSILEKIGQGSYGTVRLVEKDGTYYALKEISKQKLTEHDKTESVYRERDTLSKLKHPGFSKIFQTFSDEDNLYFLMEHVPNGSLQSLLDQQDEKRLPLPLCKFYAAWLVLSLEYLHSLKIVHRDLKPANILVDENFYLKIIDFGDSKEIEEVEEDQPEDLEAMYNRQNFGSEANEGSFFGMLRESIAQGNAINIRLPTFVGTPLYVAPEMITDHLAGKFTDLWALGCIIYQFHVGKTPFQGKSQSEVFEAILYGEYKFPPTVDADTKHLITALLDSNYRGRLGMRGYHELKNHKYFKDVDFERLNQRDITVPCPQVFNGGKKSTLVNEPEETFTEQISQMSKQEEQKSIQSSTQQSHMGMTNTTDFLVKHHFDDCCRGKLDVDTIVMEGWVKVRRKLFFYKRRQIFLLENGTVYIVKEGHISNEIKLSKHTEITHLGDNKFLISSTKTYEYVECESADVAQTWVNILMNIRKMTVEGHHSKHSSSGSKRKSKSSTQQQQQQEKSHSRQ